jgi:hypothetical protein
MKSKSVFLGLIGLTFSLGLSASAAEVQSGTCASRINHLVYGIRIPTTAEKYPYNWGMGDKSSNAYKLLKSGLAKAQKSFGQYAVKSAADKDEYKLEYAAYFNKDSCYGPSLERTRCIDIQGIDVRAENLRTHEVIDFLFDRDPQDQNSEALLLVASNSSSKPKGAFVCESISNRSE